MNKILETVAMISRPNTLSDIVTKTDYLSAPASTRYHLCRPGGLAEHSWNVFELLKQDMVALDTAIICGLFHDVCKTNFYVPTTKRERINGEWQDVSGYAVDDKLPLGHGEKSVILLSRYVRLTADEMLAIRWHMGPWVECDRKYLNDAMKCELLKKLMLADMRATWLVDGRKI